MNHRCIVFGRYFVAIIGIAACTPVASFTSPLNSPLPIELLPDKQAEILPEQSTATPPATTAPALPQPSATSKTATALPTVIVSPASIEPSPSPQSCNKPSQLKATASQATTLTVEDLRSAEHFEDEQQRWIKLSEGVFDEGKTHIALDDKLAFGNLNGDSVLDGVVVLRRNYGGTGIFPLVVAVIDRNGIPYPIASKSLYDRTRIENISIEDGDIILNLIIHQRGDGMCCPSRKATWKYRLCGEQLIRIYASAEIQ